VQGELVLPPAMEAVVKLSGANLGLVAVIASFGLAMACGEDSGDTPSGAPDAGTGGAGARGGSGGGGGNATGGTGGQVPVCPEFSPTPGALPELGLTVLLAGDTFGVALVGVVAGHVFFHDNNLLQRIPITGGAPETVGPLVGRWPGLRGTDLLYWTQSDSITAPASIVTAPLSDPTASTVVVENVAGLEDVLLDETHAYWSTRDPANIHRVPLSGGTPEVFVAGGGPIGSLVHQGYYWWHDFTTSNLERIALSGGTRERLTEIHHGGSMAGDNDAVYWGDDSLNTIEKWSAGSGRVRLASGNPNVVMVHEGTIYWTDGFIDGGVRSVRTDGTDAKGLLCGLMAPDALFVEGSYLIVNSDDGILRINR
jgi:hypothetical protein